jgi:hypothetical protein
MDGFEYNNDFGDNSRTCGRDLHHQTINDKLEGFSEREFHHGSSLPSDRQGADGRQQRFARQ